MAGVYRPRHPERTVLYRVLFHYFERFLAEYESRFKKEDGFLRTVIKEVVDRYLDCSNPKCGFARIRCPDCGELRLLMFSCRTRGFCPSCHAKRLEEWGETVCFKVLTGEDLVPGVVAAIQTFGDRINLHPHLLFPKVWAAKIRKVYELDPMLCPKCGGAMKVISFLTFLTDFS
jgi:ribosomal protein S27E